MCDAVTTGSNSIGIFALVTDFRPEYNADFGGPQLSGNLADKGIVESTLAGDRTPTYAHQSGTTPTTTGNA